MRQDPRKLRGRSCNHSRPASTPRVEVLGEAAVSQLSVLDAADLILVLHVGGESGMGVAVM